MVDIINFLLLFIFCVVIIRYIAWAYKRLIMLSKLKKLTREHSGEVKLLRFPLLPNTLTNEKPDISVKILDTVYLIRLYSGGNRYSLVHFASEEFSVRYMKMASRMVTIGRWRSSIVDAAQAFAIGAKVFVIPPMKIPEELTKDGVRVEKIMLFNPAPNTVSYVTPEKTTIKLAFTGDELFGAKIFTASSFVAYADRQTRKNDDMIYFS